MPPPVGRWLGASESGLTQRRPIVDIGISRNGKFAVTSDPQCVFRVFSLENGACTSEAKVPAKFKAKFDHLRGLSVSDDGRRVAGQLENWIVSGDVTQWAPEVRASSTIFGVARALPDGRRWAHLYGDLDVYDGAGGEHHDAQRRGVDLDVAADGRLVASFHDMERETGALCVFSPELKLLASIDVNDVLHAGRVAFVDDDHVVALSHEGRVYWWDVEKGKLRASKLRIKASGARLLGPLRAIVTDHDSNRVDKRVLDLRTGEPLVTTPMGLWAVSADGSVLVAARGASLVRCDPRTFEALEAASTLRTNVRGVAFEASGEYLWSADDEHALRWSVRDGRVDTTIAVQATEEGTRIAGDASALVVRNTFKSAMRLTLPEGTRAGTADGSWRELPVSFDGALFARTTGTSMQLKTWDGEVSTEWPMSERVSAAAFSPDGELFVTCYRGGHVDVRKAASGAVVSRFESGAPRTFDIAVSPRAEWLAICSDSPTIYVVDVARGSLAHRFKLPKRTTGPVALSADGAWVAASDQEKTAVWSLATGERAHLLKVGATSLAFSPDSTQLAIGGAGCLVIVSVFAQAAGVI